MSLALFVSCQKQQTEAERRAEIERQVQERLATERAAQQQQQLDQTQAGLDAREHALAQHDTTTPTFETPREAEPRTADSTTSYATFYQKLEPYGSWFETNTYGYVWQPRAAEQSPNWRPYSDGHWVYTDAGWTWISEEPYGWATYHYGRWTRLRNVGWVWVPADEWAPAWVSWRKSDEYVGWAPLPPEAQFDRRRGIHNWADNYYDISPDEYVFVPVNELGAQRVDRIAVPPERNLTIVNQTTNVTSITYNNSIIVNHGPNYDQLRSRTRQPIEHYRLERETSSTEDRPAVRGEVIAIPDPITASVADHAEQRPPSVKQRIANAVVENGWNTIADRAAADQARAKMKAEAPPPVDAPLKTFVRPETAKTAPATTTTSPSETPIAASTATVAAAETPTATPRPRATLTPPIAASAASATPMAPRRPAYTLPPSASPAATRPATVAPASPAATPKQSFDAARRDRRAHEQQTKAADELRRDAFRRQRQRDATSLPQHPLNTAAPAGSAASSPASSSPPAATVPPRVGGGPAKEQPPPTAPGRLPGDLVPQASPAATAEPSASPSPQDQ